MTLTLKGSTVPNIAELRTRNVLLGRPQHVARAEHQGVVYRADGASAGWLSGSCQTGEAVLATAGQSINRPSRFRATRTSPTRDHPTVFQPSAGGTPPPRPTGTHATPPRSPGRLGRATTACHRTFAREHAACSSPSRTHPPAENIRTPPLPDPAGRSGDCCTGPENRAEMALMSLKQPVVPAIFQLPEAISSATRSNMGAAS